MHPSDLHFFPVVFPVDDDGQPFLRQQRGHDNPHLRLRRSPHGSASGLRPHTPPATPTSAQKRPSTAAPPAAIASATAGATQGAQPRWASPSTKIGTRKGPRDGASARRRRLSAAAQGDVRGGAIRHAAAAHAGAQAAVPKAAVLQGPAATIRRRRREQKGPAVADQGASADQAAARPTGAGGGGRGTASGGGGWGTKGHDDTGVTPILF